jgi:ABC transporter DrrB family efflux protein
MDDVRPPLVELTVTRIKEFVREPEALFWVFGFPILLTLSLGFAFRETPADKVPVGVVQSAGAELYVRALSKSPALQPRLYAVKEGQEALRRGEVTLLIEAGDPPVYRFDPTHPEARTIRVEADNALQAAFGRRDVFQPREEHVREQGSRYIDFLVPGLLGMNLIGTGMWGVGFSVVNARMKKLLKRFIATPMRKSHYLIAQFFSRFVFLVCEVVLLVAFGWLVFGVAVHGSLLLFSLICVVGGMTFASMGILVASRVRTVEAVSGLMNLVMLPMWICSGIFFSYERFPDAVKPLIRALPLTALIDALRAVMNDAASLSQVTPQVVNLLLWTFVTYFVGLRIFRWQ